MILITGMPRSGTSYLQKVFAEYGDQMDPKCWSEYLWDSKVGMDPWHLSEGMAISSPIRKGASGDRLINLLKAGEGVWRRPGLEPVYKLPQLAFFRNEITVFRRVIICVRDLKGWYRSAKNFEEVPWYIGTEPENLKPHLKRINGSDDPILELGRVWLEQCDELLVHLRRIGFDVMVFQYGNRASMRGCLKSFGSEVFADKILSETWTGSRWDSAKSKETKP